MVNFQVCLRKRIQRIPTTSICGQSHRFSRGSFSWGITFPVHQIMIANARIVNACRKYNSRGIEEGAYGSPLNCFFPQFQFLINAILGFQSLQTFWLLG